MKKYTDQLDKILTEYLVKKAPVLSKGIKNFLVQVAPFFAILSVIVGLPAFLAIFSFGAVIAPVAWVVGARTGMFWILWAVGLVQIVIAAKSIKPLFDRAGHGWRLMYYSQLLAIVSSLGNYNLANLLFTVASLYLLYQVKSSYK